jgi:oxygen-independent coproporphyrinogen-3 oxidase
VHALEEGRFPITRGFRYTPTDLRLTSLFQMLHAMEVDLGAYRTIFGVDLLAEFAPVWEALVERGWVEIRDGKLLLVGDGVFYTPLVQDLLHRDRMDEIRRSKGVGVGDLGA